MCRLIYACGGKGPVKSVTCLSIFLLLCMLEKNSCIPAQTSDMQQCLICLPSRRAGAGLVGLSLSYALAITGLLNSALTSFAETEQEMVSLERILDYSALPPQVSAACPLGGAPAVLTVALTCQTQCESSAAVLSRLLLPLQDASAWVSMQFRLAMLHCKGSLHAATPFHCHFERALSERQIWVSAGGHGGPAVRCRRRCTPGSGSRAGVLAAVRAHPVRGRLPTLRRRA